ncbi:glycerophosphodiester phosphodiesterase family protein, partial [Pelagibacteraceae bacterium]|nr:glycerophosphodiester phosphodiesterase family protein [Pelagibacteraceae bacterium]
MTIHYIHRGLAKKDLKENTLPAFRYSFKKKYGIETDLHITKDNKFICFHYYNLKSTFNIKKKIKDIKYSYIKKITN